MTSFVIDASVAIRWVVEEDGTQEALSLRRHRLLAPDLLAIECGNILWKKVRRREMTAREATLAAGLLARAGVELAPMRDLVQSAVELAVRLDHPAYDCVYIALAAARGCDVITADQRLVAKAHAASLSTQIVSLH